MEPAQQVGRFRTLLEKLAEFPDRDLIYQIWQCAKLGLETGQVDLAGQMSGALLDLLEDAGLAKGRRVPLFYALDAIVKNVGGAYQPLFALRLGSAFEKSFGAVTDKDKLRMHHVLRTWNDKKFFIESLDHLNAVVAPWHIAFTAQQQTQVQRAQELVQEQQKAKQIAQEQALVAQQQQALVAQQQQQQQRPRRAVVPAKPVVLAKPVVIAVRRRPRQQQQQQPPPVAAPVGGPGTNYYAEFQQQRRRQRQLMMAGKQQLQEPVNGQEQPVQVQQQQAAPLRPSLAVSLPGQEKSKKIEKKRRKMEVQDDEEPGVVALAREQLYDLQAQMNEPNPMSLEEVAHRRPELFEKIIEEARAKLDQKRRGQRLLETWPSAVEPGPPAGSDANQVARHALRVATALDYRAAAYARGAAPPSVRKELVDQAERMAGHLRTLVRRRERVLAAAETIARTVAEEVRNKLQREAEKRQQNEDLRRRRRLRGPDNQLETTNDEYHREREEEDPAREEKEITELAEARFLALKAAKAVPPRVAFLSGEFLASLRGDLQKIVEAPADPRAVESLSEALPFHSKDDGLRFGTRLELQRHAKKVKAKSKTSSTSRTWGPTQRQWTHESDEDLRVECHDLFEQLREEKQQRLQARQQQRTKNNVESDKVFAPSDAAEISCGVCGDSFTLAWDDDGRGFLEEAVRVPVKQQQTTAIVHRHCRDATCNKEGQLTKDQLIQPSPRKSGGLLEDTSQPMDQGDDYQPDDDEEGQSEDVNAAKMMDDDDEEEEDDAALNNLL